MLRCTIRLSLAPFGGPSTGSARAASLSTRATHSSTPCSSAGPLTFAVGRWAERLTQCSTRRSSSSGLSLKTSPFPPTSTVELRVGGRGAANAFRRSDSSGQCNQARSGSFCTTRIGAGLAPLDWTKGLLLKACSCPFLHLHVRTRCIAAARQRSLRTILQGQNQKSGGSASDGGMPHRAGSCAVTHPVNFLPHVCVYVCMYV